MFIMSLVSSFFVFGACVAYGIDVASRGRLTLFLVCGFLAVVFSLAVSPELLATAIVLIVAGIVCRGLKASPRRFSCAAIACTLFVYAGFGLSQLPTFLERQRLRERYPMESLSERLEYERRSQAPPHLPADSAIDSSINDADEPTAAPSNRGQSLDALEKSLAQSDWPWRSRSEALRIIHSSYVEQFVASPGFGLERMPRMRSPEKYADAPEPKVFTLPPAEYFDPDGTPIDAATPDSRSPVDPGLASPLPARRQLETLHEEGLFDFINSRGWGFVQDRDHVAGFQPHQFRKSPVLPAVNVVTNRPYEDSDSRSWEDFNRERVSREPDQNWQICKLQLVSLLRHDKPAVYVTDELPRMDRLSAAPVRPLDTFERSSLKSLEQGEDVVWDSRDANGIRMLGAIRAAKQCLQCHSVERGELLGAFSYLLERTSPVRERRTPSKPIF